MTRIRAAAPGTETSCIECSAARAVARQLGIAYTLRDGARVDLGPVARPLCAQCLLATCGVQLIVAAPLTRQPLQSPGAGASMMDRHARRDVRRALLRARA